MGLSRHSILWAAMGLSLASFACGDSNSDTSDDGTSGSNDSKDGGSNGGQGIDINGGSNSGNGASAGANTGSDNTGGSSSGCTGPGQQCMCSNGMMGFQACTNGVLDECTCGIDLSDAGLPPPSDCPATATCQSTMGFVTGADGFCTPTTDGGGGGGPGGLSFPPMCTTKTDCETAGLPGAACTSIMIPILGAQQLCAQPCIPAP